MSTHSWQFVCLVAFVIWYVSTQAGRLDRLHHRIDVATAALDTHLARRAGIVAEVASSDVLDVVTAAMLLQSAHDALASGDLDDANRLSAESDLSDVLCAALDDLDQLELTDPVQIGLMDELQQMCGRVVMSHTFHTDAVNDCVKVRSQFLVKALFLAGRAPMPKPLHFRDDVPVAFAK
jgi:hypothetical protein